MPDSTNYQTRIESYGWDELQKFWQAIKTKDTPDWPTGKAFEYLILRAFQLEGADVTYPYQVQVEQETVEQIDGAIYCDGLACLIEAKDQISKVNVEPIAKMRNQLLRRHASTIGVVFSRSGFTPAASILAQYLGPQMIMLWSGDEIGYALERRLMRRALVKKYRICIEKGIPDHNIMSEGTP